MKSHRPTRFHSTGAEFVILSGAERGKTIAGDAASDGQKALLEDASKNSSKSSSDSEENEH